MVGLSIGWTLLVAWSDGAYAATVRTEQTDSSVVFSSGWTLYSDAAASGGSRTYSSAVGSTATFTVTVATDTTATVSLIGEQSAYGGPQTYSVDGGTAISWTSNNGVGAGTSQAVGFTTAPLAAGTHTVTVTVAGSNCDVDAFDVVDSPVATTTTSSTSSTSSTTSTSTTAAPTTTSTAPGSSTPVTLPESTDDQKRAAGAVVLVLSLTCGLVAGKTLFR
jgi:hypothetical protein